MKKISLDPMPALRQAAEERINTYFNGAAAHNAQQDQEHRRKREIAERVIQEGAEVAPFAFAEEARLMAVSVSELASMIVSKPDAVLERGLERRRLVLAVRAAQTPAALKDILYLIGIRD